MRRAKTYNLIAQRCIFEQMSSLAKDGDRQCVAFIKIGSSQNVVAGYSDMRGKKLPIQLRQFLCVLEKFSLLSLSKHCSARAHEFLASSLPFDLQL